jgi:hypothetical protein
MSLQKKFINETIQERISLLRQLVKMAKADKIFKEVEYRYLIDVSQLLNIPIQVVDVIIEEDVENILPITFDERIKQIHRLAIMMMVDGIITIEEMDLLKNLTLEMGLLPNSLEIMIRKMNSNIGGLLLIEDLRDIFSVTNN